MRLANLQARYVADKLHSTITAEQAPIWTRIAELETLRQAKMAQEQAQERLQAVQRHQVGSEPQERRRPAPERLKVVSERQERPQDPQQERAQQLREAFETLDKRTAMQRFPELARLYPIMAEAARSSAAERD